MLLKMFKHKFGKQIKHENIGSTFWSLGVASNVDHIFNWSISLYLSQAVNQKVFVAHGTEIAKN